MTRTAACISIAILLCGMSFANAPGAKETLQLADFQNPLGPMWQEKSLRNKTDYQRIFQDGGWALRAVARDSASTLGMSLMVDPAEFPVLRWRWRVDKLPSGGDEFSRRRDDAAARILLIFNRSIFPWRIRTICYLWANTLAQGQTAENVFSSNAKLVAVRSGPDLLGTWLTEERNYVEDYRKLFGESPKKLEGIAILTDTDHTHSEAIAWYGPIELR